MKTLDLTDKKIIRDAVELGKGNFTEYYVAQGYRSEYISSIWHDLKKTSFAQSIAARSNTRYQAPEKEIKRAYKELDVEVKQSLEDIVDNPYTGDRRDQVRQAFESGITSPSAIQKIIGGNSAYISRIIKELGLRE